MPAVEEDWVFKLCDGDRYLQFSATGELLPSTSSYKMRTISHSLYTRPLSTTAFFEQGVVQIMGADTKHSHFGSSDAMQRAYFMGGGGAVDILRSGATGGEQDQVVLLNAEDPVVAGYSSGVREVIVGTFRERDVWCAGSSSSDVQTIADSGAPATWSREWKIAPNNRNFPTATLPVGSVSNMDSDTTSTSSSSGSSGNSNSTTADLESLMTGIYGSAVPCLCTYPNEVTDGYQVAQIATTLRYGNSKITVFYYCL